MESVIGEDELGWGVVEVPVAVDGCGEPLAAMDGSRGFGFEASEDGIPVGTGLQFRGSLDFRQRAVEELLVPFETLGFLRRWCKFPGRVGGGDDGWILAAVAVHFKTAFLVQPTSFAGGG